MKKIKVLVVNYLILLYNSTEKHSNKLRSKHSNDCQRFFLMVPYNLMFDQ